MLTNVAMCQVLTIVYILMEIRAQNLPRWFAAAYLYLIGVAIYSTAFGSCNLILFVITDDRESRGWFYMFAWFSHIVAAILLAVSMIIGSLIWRRLSMRSFYSSGTILYCISVFALLAISKIPMLNWY